MIVTRSVKCSLKFLTKNKLADVHSFMDEYARVSSDFSRMTWFYEVEKSDLKKEIINLPESWLTARSRQCAAREALATKESLWQQIQTGTIEGPCAIPTHNGKKVTLSSQCVTIEEAEKAKEFDLWVTLGSIGKGLKIQIPIRKHKRFHHFVDDGWSLASSIELHRTYLKFIFTKEISKKADGECLGLDVGVNTLLAISNGELRGRKIRELISNIHRKEQGSHGWKRACLTLKYYLQTCTKDFFKEHPDLRLLVVEKLDGLKRGTSQRKRIGRDFRRILNNWNYRELLDYIQRQCEVNRVSFRTVSPWKTSQTCSSCNHVEKRSRNGEDFRCVSCGYQENADTNGAKNILYRFLHGPYGAVFQT